SEERQALRQAYKDRSADVAWADYVPANAALAEFVGPGPSEGANRSLRGAVNAHARKALDVGNRSGQDDPPADKRWQQHSPPKVCAQRLARRYARRQR